MFTDISRESVGATLLRLLRSLMDLWYGPYYYGYTLMWISCMGQPTVIRDVFSSVDMHRYNKNRLESCLTSWTMGPRLKRNNLHTSPKAERLVVRTMASLSLAPEMKRR